MFVLHLGGAPDVVPRAVAVQQAIRAKFQHQRRTLAGRQRPQLHVSLRAKSSSHTLYTVHIV